MPHLSQRKETNCLNCGTEVIGKYCHNCGQENTEPEESFWHLVSHFFNDFTHFDSKFFSTVKDIIFKPGYLSKEYMRGRRASYLNPVRMYFFTSFIFFLVFFSAYHLPQNVFKNAVITLKGKTIAQIDSLPDADFHDFTKLLNDGKPMTRQQFSYYSDSVRHNGGLHFFATNNKIRNFKNRKEYDSLVTLGKINDGWLRRKFTHKEIEINNKYHNNGGAFLSDFFASLMHHFPQMLFISLPFVALFLKLLYIRQKKFYYVSHAIFTIHLYIFVFIVLLIEIGFYKLNNLFAWRGIDVIINLFSLSILFYLYKAMRNFYEQKRFKTIVKYILLLFSFLFLIVLLFSIFSFISVFQI